MKHLTALMLSFLATASHAQFAGVEPRGSRCKTIDFSVSDNERNRAGYYFTESGKIRLPQGRAFRKYDLGDNDNVDAYFGETRVDANALCDHWIWFALWRRDYRVRRKFIEAAPQRQAAMLQEIAENEFRTKIDEPADVVDRAAQGVYDAFKRLGVLPIFMVVRVPFPRGEKDASQIHIVEAPLPTRVAPLTDANRVARAEAFGQLWTGAGPGPALQAYYDALRRMAVGLGYQTRTSSPWHAVVHLVGDLAYGGRTLEYIAQNPDEGWFDFTERDSWTGRPYLNDHDLAVRNQIFTNFAIIETLLKPARLAAESGEGVEGAIGRYAFAVAQGGRDAQLAEPRVKKKNLDEIGPGTRRLLAPAELEYPRPTHAAPFPKAVAVPD